MRGRRFTGRPSIELARIRIRSGPTPAFGVPPEFFDVSAAPFDWTQQIRLPYNLDLALILVRETLEAP